MFISYVLLAATIYYGSTGVLAAPISASRLAPRQIDTSLDVREFGLSSTEPLTLRMYNEVLNDRAIDAKIMETREPRQRAGGKPRLTRAERQDRDKASLRALSAPPGVTSYEHHHVALTPLQEDHHHVALIPPQVDHHHVPLAPHQGVDQPAAPKSFLSGFVSKVQNHWLVGQAKSWFGRSKVTAN